MWVCWLLELYVLATSKVISGQLPTFDSAHPWRLYSAAPLTDQATGTMTRYPTQPHYPDSALTSPCCTPLSPSTSRGSSIGYQLCKSLVWFDRDFFLNYQPSTREACALPIRPPRLVHYCKHTLVTVFHVSYHVSKLSSAYAFRVMITAHNTLHSLI